MPCMGLHDGAEVFGHKLPGGGALVNVPDCLLLVKDKVVGIDLSTLLHGLCQSKDIQQMQAVDPRNSVVYPVANLLNTYFKAKALDQARSIIAVCDPKRLNCHHCSQCQETYEAAYATKCDITGRAHRGVAAAAAEEAYTKALAAYNEATNGTDDTHSARNIEGQGSAQGGVRHLGSSKNSSSRRERTRRLLTHAQSRPVRVGCVEFSCGRRRRHHRRRRRRRRRRCCCCCC